MVEKNAAQTMKKPRNNHFKLMSAARKSGAIGRIFDAFNSIDKNENSYQLIPSKFHVAASLYTANIFLDTNIFGELIWGSVILQKRREDIDKYLKFKRTMEMMVLHSKWNEALSLITDFELEHGTALVIKELAIAITQQADGTAKQVTYSRKLEAQCSRNAFVFIRFASERNEDRLTLSGFRRNFRENYAGKEIPPLAATVVNWHGLRQLPNDEKMLSQLLSFEGAGSIFDYFEVFVAVSTHLAARSSPEVRNTLKNSLQRISKINDPRIFNLTQLLSAHYGNSKSELTVTNVLKNIRDRSNRGDVSSSFENVIFNLFQDKVPAADIRRSIHKLSANFFHLDFFQAVFCNLEHKASIACLDQAVAPGTSVLAAETTLRSLFSCSFEVAQEIISKLPSGIETNAVNRPFEYPISDEGIDALLFSAITLAKNGEIDSLIKLVNSVEINSIDRSHLQLIAIGACYESGKYVELLPFALDVSEVRLDSLSLVPIVQALESILPGRLSGRDAALFSIVASRVLIIEESDRLEDKLLVAAEVALFGGKSTPLWVREDEVSLKIWVCYLRDVLVVQNMLLIDDIDSLRDALNLRVEVLRQLIELDPDGRAKYHEEVRDIAFSLSVDEGIRQVNTSRLNVNINGLTKWANEHCVDDYERYKELVTGEANAGDVPIKLAGGSASILDQVAIMPFGVADDQFVKLLIKIRNAYLSDPRNGLDAYISLRVRHGSLSGTLSRGLDIRQLLLLRKGEGGPFEPPNYWIEKFELSGNQITDVTRSFAIFTDSFRKSIDDLLKNRLHVKNDRNPQGEITVEVTDIFVKGLKFDILADLSFDAFISTVFISYKNTVSAYLDSLREYLKTDFLNNAANALEALSVDVGRIVVDVNKQGYLSDAITNARLDLQSSIRVVCGWLEIAQKEDLTQLYTLKQAAEIGINYTKQVRNDFVPKISINGVDESFRVTGGSLVAVVDILFILLDNVYKHAGFPNERTISLDFDFSENGLIKIKMKNDLAVTTSKIEVGLRFEAARKLISNGEGEKKLTEENQSGLPKLSKLVAQDRPDALIFDVGDDGVEVNVFVGYSSLGLSA